MLENKISELDAEANWKMKQSVCIKIIKKQKLNLYKIYLRYY